MGGLLMKPHPLRKFIIAVPMAASEVLVFLFQSKDMRLSYFQTEQVLIWKKLF